MIRKGKKRILSIILSFAVLSALLGGCGSLTASEKEEDMLSGSETGQKTQQYAEGTPMGRYVESRVEFSGGVMLSGNGNGLYKRDNGQIIVTDSIYSFLISKDRGKNWFEDKRTWRSKMMDEGSYILSAAIGGDNTAAVIYQKAVENENSPNEEIVLNPCLLLIKPDKTEIETEVTLTEADDRLRSVYISQEGRIFVTTLSSNIYEIMEDGSSELFLTVEDGMPELIQFQNNLMFIDGVGYDSLLIYDMEQKKYIEDEVLEDFIMENYRNRSGFSGNWYDMFFFGGEEGILYIAGEKGVYRHVLGGSVMEQIIDGNLSIFSNPSYAIAGMIALEDNKFLTLFSGGILVWFTYNPDIPTVPIEQLKVYGLEDNATIRQAINQYQTTNPEIYVEYEVGMEKGSSITRDDALKNLNTRIMAGEGPDIFILDDMPVDSYIEKGVLSDLSPVFDNMSGEDELFGNIVDAFRTGEGIYMMPCEVRLPAIVSRKSDITGIKNLSDIADVVEKLRKDHPEGDLLKLYTEKGIMRMFSPVSEPMWMTEEGAVDREMISEFLEQTKRIYDAQMDGIADHILEAYETVWNASAEENFGVPWDETDIMRISMDCLRFAGGMIDAVWGYIDSVWTYAEIVSVSKVQGYEDCGWVPMNGQCENIFFAKTLLGISAASEQTEAAEDFVKALFGKEIQGNLYGGLPVNKAAFLAGSASGTGDGTDERWGSSSTNNYEGHRISLTVCYLDQSQAAELQAYMESVKIPYIENTVLESAVYEEGIAYMQGRKSLSEALDSIEKKMAIYLAE